MKTKLKTYLKETGIVGINPDTDIPIAIDHIRKNCKKIVKEVQGYDFPYRGFLSMESAKRVIPNSTLLYEHTVRKDRKPRYITPKTHEFLSDYSKKHFGWDIRKEGLFTGSRNTAGGYGKLRAVLPIGNYQYVLYSKGLFDLYRLYDRPISWPQEFGNDEDYEKYFKEITKLMKNYKRNKGLTGSVQNQGAAWECIFKCDKYYSISTIHVDRIINELY